MKYIIIEKAQVKPYTRTRKGKMERVAGHQRAIQMHNLAEEYVREHKERGIDIPYDEAWHRIAEAYGKTKAIGAYHAKRVEEALGASPEWAKKRREESKKIQAERKTALEEIKERIRQKWMETHKEPSREVTVSKPPLGSKVAGVGAVEGGAKEVAMTILSQMGGVGRIQAMTGAKNFAYFDEKGKKGVSFDFPNRGNKPNFVKVTLDEGTDTYTVEFGKKKPISWKRMEKIAEQGRDPKAEDFYTKLSEHTDIYWDQLKELFEKNTGLYLSFSKALLVVDLDKAQVKPYTRTRRGRLERVAGYLRTNAQINRAMAFQMLQAGMTPAGIAKEFPEVFKITIEDGRERLGQKYDFEFPDGRKETKRMITQTAVDRVIKKFKGELKGEIEKPVVGERMIDPRTITYEGEKRAERKRYDEAYEKYYPFFNMDKGEAQLPEFTVDELVEPYFHGYDGSNFISLDEREGWSIDGTTIEEIAAGLHDHYFTNAETNTEKAYEDIQDWAYDWWDKQINKYSGNPEDLLSPSLFEEFMDDLKTEVGKKCKMKFAEIDGLIKEHRETTVPTSSDVQSAYFGVHDKIRRKKSVENWYPTKLSEIRDYLKEHGWKRNLEYAVRKYVSKEDPKAKMLSGKKVKKFVDDLPKKVETPSKMHIVYFSGGKGK